MLTDSHLEARVSGIRSRIAQAARSAGRDPASITLIAVSKTKPAQDIEAAAAAGVTDFGENYLKEAVGKMEQLAGRPLVWHFIGHLQSNKTRLAAERFDWVHSVDRLSVAQRLSQQRPPHAPALAVCLQVALVPEPDKGGIEPAAAAALARQVAVLPRLRLRGLMCIPPVETSVAAQRGHFARLRELRDALNAEGLGLDALSMGMSEDFEV